MLIFLGKIKLILKEDLLLDMIQEPVQILIQILLMPQMLVDLPDSEDLEEHWIKNKFNKNIEFSLLINIKIKLELWNSKYYLRFKLIYFIRVSYS